ncbi:MAG: hypothetical protein IJM45_05500 [Clostridia bacterium]|nr:hypothetical protein [Clostridia bacterium]
MKRTFAVILSLLLLITVCPVTVFTVDVTVTYLERSWDSVKKEIVETDGTVTAPLSFPNFQMGEHWYYVGENKTFENRVTIPNSTYVNLIIGDGVTINCKKGINVSSSAMLNIYCQTAKTGKLIATGNDYNAGIGSDDEAEVNGAIRIYGGVIVATGGDDSAGIVGGNEMSCGLVEVYGGTVTPKGGPHAAGIGDGDEAPDEAGLIKIDGGTIMATGGERGNREDKRYRHGGIHRRVQSEDRRGERRLRSSDRRAEGACDQRANALRRDRPLRRPESLGGNAGRTHRTVRARYALRR